MKQKVSHATSKISLRVSLVVGLILILGILIEGVLSLVMYRNDSINTQAERAKSIAVSVASAFVDPDSLRDAFETVTETDYWKEMKSYLDHVKRLTAVSYLYVLDTHVGDEIYYIMEGAMPGETTPVIGASDSSEEFAMDELLEALNSGTPASGVYDSAEYGVYVFCYAPITGSVGQCAGIVGVDIHISNVTAASTRFALHTALISLIFCIVLSLLASFYIRRSVGNPLDRAAQLQEAHERVKVFLDAMPFPCRLWSADFKVIDCNDEAVRFYGLKDKAEMIERFADLYPEYQPDGRLSSEVLEMTLTKAFAEGKYVYEAMHRTPDGRMIPVESILVRVRYGDDYVLACYTRDQSEYRELMSEISRGANLLNIVNGAANILLQSESNEFEQDLHRCMGMIGNAVNADRVCMWKNHKIDGRLYCDLLYDWPGGADSKKDSDVAVNVSYDENTPGWEEILSQGNCINTSVSLLSPEERTQLEAHGVKSLFVAPVFVRDEFWGYVGFDDYHTEKTFSDNEASTLRSGSLLIANALLRNEMTRSLQLAAAELEAALNAAKDANQAKSDFLAHMSHEMRTPLNAIIGLSDLTLGMENLDSESLLNLEKISNAGMTLLGTVNDILDISKIEAGRFELIPVEYDVPSLINDTISQNILRIGEKPVEFVLDISEDLPARLFGDEIRVKQMLNNLLSNAFKYTKEGMVKLSVHSERGAGDAIWVTASVMDTGIGIKPEDIDMLFGAYSQFDTRENRELEGTGLGLQITSRIAEVMQGTVTVESEYGIGSTFTVRFRQQYISDAIISAETADNLMSFHYTDYKRRGNQRLTRISLPYARVLVVDDVATNLDVARGLMKPYRMQIDCVSSGREAIDAIRNGSPHYNAIFMDHMMPGMDGVEATQHIREIGTDYAAGIPIIALTANAIAGNEEMFLDKGFQAFIPKPIEIARLDDIIKRWVRNEEQEKLYIEQHKDLIGQDIRSGSERRSGIDRRALYLGIDGLNISKGIERFGDEETYFEIIRSYAVNTPALLEKLEFVSRSSLESYIIDVHGIKGSSRGIGADVYADIAEALERAARLGDYAYISAHNTSFLEAGWKLLSDIDNMLSQIFEDNPEQGAIDSGNEIAIDPAEDVRSPENVSRRKIILVDDNLTNLDMGRKMLSEYYQVISAASAKHMFEILEKVIPDMILLDIEMPEINGYQAIKLLKADPRFASIPVLFLTAKSDEVDEQEGLSLGAADYVYKPFTALLLHKRIETHLKAGQ